MLKHANEESSPLSWHLQLASTADAVPGIPQIVEIAPGSTMMVGRGPDNDAIIDYKIVGLKAAENILSRSHARLQSEDGLVMLTDLSTNGCAGIHALRPPVR